MQEYNLLERLVAVSPGMEIWWDSSPIIFESWCRRMLAKRTPAIARRSGANSDACTTRRTPKSSCSGASRPIRFCPCRRSAMTRRTGEAWLKRSIEEHDGIDKESLFWLLYKEVVRRGSEMFLPLFEASRIPRGFRVRASGPAEVLRRARDARAGRRTTRHQPQRDDQGARHEGGLRGHRELTALGIPTNNTLTFVLPQLMDCANTVRRGLERARRTASISRVGAP